MSIGPDPILASVSRPDQAFDEGDDGAPLLAEALDQAERATEELRELSHGATTIRSPFTAMSMASPFEWSTDAA
jgi:hypothetical protein